MYDTDRRNIKTEDSSLRCVLETLHVRDQLVELRF